MKCYRICLFISLVVLVNTGCKNKKTASSTGDEPVEVGDFLGFFPKTNLPFVFTDTLLQRKERDSLFIRNNIMSQFVPDSAFHTVFAKSSKWKIYPVGKVEVPKGETYLFVKLITATKKAIYIVAFDDKDQFAAAMPAVRSDLGGAVVRSTVMDKKYTIIKTQVRKNTDGSLSEGKDIYSFSPDSKDFSLIMTDALGDQVTELLNPIDTFSKKSKWAGDYTTGSMNLVSIRDGRKADRVNFFIHFEKSNGECNGELKGEAFLRAGNMAEYRQAGDPCMLQFRFSTTSVTVKEAGACGSRRGLRCSFDGVYPRKREVKPKTVKKKTGSKKT